jgi:hypothetical protein
VVIRLATAADFPVEVKEACSTNSHHNDGESPRVQHHAITAVVAVCAGAYRQRGRPSAYMLQCLNDDMLNIIYAYRP